MARFEGMLLSDGHEVECSDDGQKTIYRLSEKTNLYIYL